MKVTLLLFITIEGYFTFPNKNRQISCGSLSIIWKLAFDSDNHTDVYHANHSTDTNCNSQEKKLEFTIKVKYALRIYILLNCPCKFETLFLRTAICIG